MSALVCQQRRRRNTKAAAVTAATATAAGWMISLSVSSTIMISAPTEVVAYVPQLGISVYSPTAAARSRTALSFSFQNNGGPDDDEVDETPFFGSTTNPFSNPFDGRQMPQPPPPPPQQGQGQQSSTPGPTDTFSNYNFSNSPTGAGPNPFENDSTGSFFSSPTGAGSNPFFQQSNGNGNENFDYGNIDDDDDDEDKSLGGIGGPSQKAENDAYYAKKFAQAEAKEQAKRDAASIGLQDRTDHLLHELEDQRISSRNDNLNNSQQEQLPFTPNPYRGSTDEQRHQLEIKAKADAAAAARAKAEQLRQEWEASHPLPSQQQQQQNQQQGQGQQSPREFRQQQFQPPYASGSGQIPPPPQQAQQPQNMAPPGNMPPQQYPASTGPLPPPPLQQGQQQQQQNPFGSYMGRQGSPGSSAPFPQNGNPPQGQQQGQNPVVPPQTENSSEIPNQFAFTQPGQPQGQTPSVPPIPQQQPQQERQDANKSVFDFFPAKNKQKQASQQQQQQQQQQQTPSPQMNSSQEESKSIFDFFPGKQKQPLKQGVGQSQAQMGNSRLTPPQKTGMVPDGGTPSNSAIFSGRETKDSGNANIPNDGHLSDMERREQAKAQFRNQQKGQESGQKKGGIASDQDVSKPSSPIVPPMQQQPQNKQQPLTNQAASEELKNGAGMPSYADTNEFKRRQEAAMQLQEAEEKEATRLRMLDAKRREQDANIRRMEEERNAALADPTRKAAFDEEQARRKSLRDQEATQKKISEDANQKLQATEESKRAAEAARLARMEAARKLNAEQAEREKSEAEENKRKVQEARENAINAARKQAADEKKARDDAEKAQRLAEAERKQAVRMKAETKKYQAEAETSRQEIRNFVEVKGRQMQQQQMVQDDEDFMSKETQLRAEEARRWAEQEARRKIGGLPPASDFEGAPATGTPFLPEDDPESVRVHNVYNKWCKFYGKRFDERRFATFTENLYEIENYYSSTGEPVQLNEFADLTEEEFDLRERNPMLWEENERMRWEEEELLRLEEGMGLLDDDPMLRDDYVESFSEGPWPQASNRIRPIKKKTTSQSSPPNAYDAAKHRGEFESDRKAELKAKRQQADDMLKEAENKRLEEAKFRHEQLAKKKAAEESKRSEEVDAKLKVVEEAQRRGEEDARRRAKLEAIKAEDEKKLEELQRNALEEAKRRGNSSSSQSVHLSNPLAGPDRADTGVDHSANQVLGSRPRKTGYIADDTKRRTSNTSPSQEADTWQAAMMRGQEFAKKKEQMDIQRAKEEKRIAEAKQQFHNSVTERAKLEAERRIKAAERENQEAEKTRQAVLEEAKRRAEEEHKKRQEAQAKKIEEEEKARIAAEETLKRRKDEQDRIAKAKMQQMEAEKARILETKRLAVEKAKQKAEEEARIQQERVRALQFEEKRKEQAKQEALKAARLQSQEVEQRKAASLNRVSETEKTELARAKAEEAEISQRSTPKPATNKWNPFGRKPQGQGQKVTNSVESSVPSSKPQPDEVNQAAKQTSLDIKIDENQNLSGSSTMPPRREKSSFTPFGRKPASTSQTTDETIMQQSLESGPGHNSKVDNSKKSDSSTATEQSDLPFGMLPPSEPFPKNTYAPFGRKPKAAESGMASHVDSVSSMAPLPELRTSQPTSQPMDPVVSKETSQTPTETDSVVSTTPKKSYIPFGRKPIAPKSIMGSQADVISTQQAAATPSNESVESTPEVQEYTTTIPESESTKQNDTITSFEGLPGEGSSTITNPTSNVSTKSYAPFGRKPKAVGSSTLPYMSTESGNLSSNSARSNDAEGAENKGLSSSETPPKKSYNPFGDWKSKMPKGVDTSTPPLNLKEKSDDVVNPFTTNPPPETSPSLAERSIPSNTIPNSGPATPNLENKKKSYAPFGSKPKVPTTGSGTSSYTSQIKGTFDSYYDSSNEKENELPQQTSVSNEFTGIGSNENYNSNVEERAPIETTIPLNVNEEEKQSPNPIEENFSSVSSQATTGAVGITSNAGMPSYMDRVAKSYVDETEKLESIRKEIARLEDAARPAIEEDSVLPTPIQESNFGEAKASFQNDDTGKKSADSSDVPNFLNRFFGSKENKAAAAAAAAAPRSSKAKASKSDLPFFMSKRNTSNTETESTAKVENKNGRGSKSTPSKKQSTSLPRLSQWGQTSEGCIYGFISGSSDFDDGAYIMTSPVELGAKGGSIVTTSSGSTYQLALQGQALMTSNNKPYEK